MFFKNLTKGSSGFKSSPWIVLGGSLILLFVVIVLTFINTNREKAYMSKILLEKGAALIRSFEAGTRTGMMGMMWGGTQVQRLLEETAKQPDIKYLSMISRDGEILAHNKREKIGENILSSIETEILMADQTERWRITEDSAGTRIFEVFRQFVPLKGIGMGRNRSQYRGHRMGFMGRNRKSPNIQFSPENIDQIIFVGLDVTPFEEARLKDIRHSIMMAAILILLGFGGFVSLYWAERYRSTRRSLQDTSAFASEVVTQLPVGLIATDRNGKITFLNHAAEKISGMNMIQVKGKSPDEIMPAYWNDLKILLDSGQTILDREKESIFPNKNTVPVSVSASRIINEEGYFVGYIIIIRDLTEIRSLQNEIRRKEKLASLGNLAAGVAHEIRNPLSSIKGMASFLAGKFDKNSENKEAADVMIKEVDRLNRVINELLEFARPAELNNQKTDMNALLNHSVRLIRQDAKAKNINIELLIDDEIITSRIDPDRMTQCLLNLYINAIQSMENGGTLSIKSLINTNGSVVIKVDDTGEGISSENINKIFDPYFTSKPDGTGLGLAIVHKIIEALNSSIDVKSTVGQGTVFTITIPSGL